MTDLIQEYAYDLSNNTITAPVNGSWIQAAANYLGLTQAVNGSWIEAICYYYGITQSLNGSWVQALAVQQYNATTPVNGTWWQAIVDGTGGSSYDAAAQSFFDSVATRGYTMSTSYKTAYNNMIVQLKSSGDWTNLDSLYLFATVDTDVAESDRKKIVLTDVKNPTLVGSLKSDYSGSHIGGIGFAGSPVNTFGVLTQFNAASASNWKRDNASYGALFMGTASAMSAWDIGSSDSGFGTFNNVTRTYPPQGEMLVNDATIGSYTYRIDKANAYSWWSSIRATASLTTEYVNGCLMARNTQPSVAPVSTNTGLLGAYNGSWTGGFYSSNIIGAFYAGNSSLNHNTISSIINTYGLLPINKKSYLNKNMFGQGDSIFSAAIYGIFGLMYKKTIETLNDHWTLTNLCLANQTATAIDTDFATLTAPYYRSTWSSNVFLLSAGTNDIATATKTGAQLYTVIKSICTKAKAAGWPKVIVSGIPARAGAMGVSQLTFDTECAAFRALMLADFGVTSSIAHYFTSNTVTYATGYLDIIADGNYASASNAYFMADNIHFSALGNENYATTYCAPLMILNS